MKVSTRGSLETFHIMNNKQGYGFSSVLQCTAPLRVLACGNAKTRVLIVPKKAHIKIVFPFPYPQVFWGITPFSPRICHLLSRFPSERGTDDLHKGLQAMSDRTPQSSKTSMARNILLHKALKSRAARLHLCSLAGAHNTPKAQSQFLQAQVCAGRWGCCSPVCEHHASQRSSCAWAQSMPPLWGQTPEIHNGNTFTIFLLPVSHEAASGKGVPQEGTGAQCCLSFLCLGQPSSSFSYKLWGNLKWITNTGHPCLCIKHRSFTRQTSRF